MGQAKLRGPREIRVAEGIARRAEESRLREEEIRIRKEQEAARVAAMTPEQRQRRSNARGLMATMGVLATMGALGSAGEVGSLLNTAKRFRR